MERLERILSMLEYALGNRKKSHIAGGILLSVSMLFGGLAFTVMTLKHNGEEEKESKDEERYFE